ncbi:TRAP transporter small permease subunit [Ammoniphilus sp. 3BR4]|uniref:TRAP transporter small permease subunit n=1 Tax=Ammoniphilus sp. 3BR4 TaxID=3158265 RepID=UPI0034660B3E
MEVIKKITRIIDGISNWVGKVGAWSVLVIMVLVVFEVVSRRVFNAPTIWTFETITMLYGVHFMTVAAYGLLHKAMVSVDSLYEKFSPKKRAVLDILSYLVLYFPFVVGIFIVSLDFMERSWAIKETSQSLFAAPVYLYKTIIPLVFGLLILQGISEVLKQVVFLSAKEEILPSSDSLSLEHSQAGYRDKEGTA